MFQEQISQGVDHTHLSHSRKIQPEIIRYTLFYKKVYTKVVLSCPKAKNVQCRDFEISDSFFVVSLYLNSDISE